MASRGRYAYTPGYSSFNPCNPTSAAPRGESPRAYLGAYNSLSSTPRAQSPGRRHCGPPGQQGSGFHINPAKNVAPEKHTPPRARGDSPYRPRGQGFHIDASLDTSQQVTLPEFRRPSLGGSRAGSPSRGLPTVGAACPFGTAETALGPAGRSPLYDTKGHGMAMRSSPRHHGVNGSAAVRSRSAPVAEPPFGTHVGDSQSINSWRGASGLAQRARSPSRIGLNGDVRASAGDRNCISGVGLHEDARASGSERRMRKPGGDPACAVRARERQERSASLTGLPPGLRYQGTPRPEGGDRIAGDAFAGGSLGGGTGRPHEERVPLRGSRAGGHAVQRASSAHRGCGGMNGGCWVHAHDNPPTRMRGASGGVAEPRSADGAPKPAPFGVDSTRERRQNARDRLQERRDPVGQHGGWLAKVKCQRGKPDTRPGQLHGGAGVSAPHSGGPQTAKRVPPAAQHALQSNGTFFIPGMGGERRESARGRRSVEPNKGVHGAAGGGGSGAVLGRISHSSRYGGPRYEKAPLPPRTTDELRM